ncbi:MAG: glycosyltransferase family 1 protein [Elusimicrobiota bacterium]
MKAVPVSVVLECGLNADFKRGIDYYVDNMVDGLVEVDQRNRYLLFSFFFREHARKSARMPHPVAPNFKTLYRRFPESLVTALDLERGVPVVEKALLRGRRFDVYHALSGGRLPHVRGAKTVVTFFDLVVEAHPLAGGRPDPGRVISDPDTYEYARRADCLVATGDQTKKDLMRFYAIPEEKIVVIPTGVNLKVFHEVADEGERRRVRARYGLPERYLMVIGPYVPPQRTNAESTLRAYAALRRAGTIGDCRLVFVGAENDHLRKLLGLAEDLGVRAQCSTTGYVALEDLAAVYGLSSGVVHPTSIEGFGYGLEVLACGVPFITSNLPGVLESVGGIAWTVTPNDVPAIEKAMGDVLLKPELCREMREKGLARAAKYSYSVVAGRLASLYERLGAEAN